MKPIAAFAAGLATATVGWVGGTYLVGRHAVNKDVNRFREHWGQRPSEHPADVLHYVALGDSAAQGVGASAVDKGYVPLIARRLQTATGRPVAITNLSVSGAVSDDLARDQLDTFKALPFRPDIVTLDIGANDVLFTPYDLDTFSASMAVILEALPKGSFIADVPWMVFPGLAGQSQAMAERAATMITESGHHLVRLHEASRAQGYFSYPRRTSKDWFHPNDQGYEQWADAFWGAIDASGVLDEIEDPLHDE